MNTWLATAAKRNTIRPAHEIIKSLRTRTSLLLLTSAALVTGATMYFAFRPPLMLFEVVGVRSGYRFAAPEPFRWLIDSLPSLLHVYAFSLLSLSLLEKKTEQTIVATISFWVVVNSLFEIGQASILKNFWGGHSFDDAASKWCAPLVSYFLYGTFDWKDLVFSVCGGVMSYLTISGRRS